MRKLNNKTDTLTLEMKHSQFTSFSHIGYQSFDILFQVSGDQINLLCTFEYLKFFGGSQESAAVGQSCVFFFFDINDRIVLLK